ncbi:NHLP bacteriocin export ABC transporter permease/ATPase subunit [Rugosimonospora acidiphila]|uniref:NHLP bacteriocin export ABC transporter permease/ATPase subunit n=1 Tax=Rugosimonospora acidiphila TaxID=556531 RepID=A0ABP9S786_9ACTN
MNEGSAISTTSAEPRKMPGEVSEWATRVGRPVGGVAGQTIVFDGSDVLYVVLNGYIDVFTARLNRLGQPHGRWREVCRLEKGSVVPSIADRSGSRLVARIGEDTRLAMIRPVDFESADGQVDRSQSRTSKGLAAALDRTLGTLADAWRSALPPREFEPIYATVQLKAGQDARPVSDAIWLRVREGDVRYGEHISGSHGPGSLLYVRRLDWLVVETDCELEPVSTLDLLVGGGIWGALSAHMMRLMEAADLRILESEEEERGALRRRAEAAHAHIEAVADRIEQVFDDRGLVQVSDVREDDPMLGALRLVGRQIGLEIKAPLTGVGGGKPERQLARILHANHAHSREVLLTGRWWKTDSGPFVLLRKNRKPAAALRTGNRYYLVDPTGAERPVPIDEKVAKGIAQTGYQIYPVLSNDVTTTGKLFRFGLSGHGGDMSRILALVLLSGAVGLAVPVLTGKVLGGFVAMAEGQMILVGSAAVMVAAVVMGVLGIVVNLSVLKLIGRVLGRMQTAVWGKLLALPVGFFRNTEAGALTRSVLGVHYSQEALAGALSVAFISMVGASLNLILIGFYSPPLALVVLALVVFAFAVTWRVGRRSSEVQAEIHESEKRSSALMLQLLTSVPKIRVTATEDRLLRLWSGMQVDNTRLKLKLRTSQNALLTFNVGYPLACTTLLFWLVGGPWKGHIDTSEFLTILTATNLLIAAVMQMTSTALIAVPIVPMLRDVETVLTEPAETHAGSVDPGELSGQVTVSEVSFRYGDGPLILDNVSLTIDPGQFVAIVGGSGSGKSTLLRLILGFEKPLRGAVTFDGLDLAELDVRAVRSQCGVVLQGGGLTPGSIRSNILGTSGLTLKDAWNAAEMAGLKEDITNMPMGMATVISEGASALSGGQRQRLMIARSLVNRPRMVCFDEATSALDNPTQKIVANSMRTLNATRLIIAHRLSTVADADRIIVLDRGKVVQQGTYSELLADEEGHFAMLARRQLA